MPIAIILGFDDESTAVLNRIFKRLKENKFNSYYELVRPHITLTSYETIDFQVAKERLSQFSACFTPFRIQFSSFGYFPSEESVLFLNPKANIELLGIQQKVFELFKDFRDERTTGTWVPHSTLATNVPLKKIGKAIDIAKKDIVMKEGAPFFVDAESIWTVDFETGPVTIISTDEFKFNEAE